jgi:hypothetical protein
MVQHKIEHLIGYPEQASELHKKKNILAFFSKDPLHISHRSLIHFKSTPLFKLEKNPEKYVYFLKKKDREHIIPVVNYLVVNPGHDIYLGGEAVKNLYLRGKRKYKSLNILAILATCDVEKFSHIMNNIISSNDGAFSMKLKYRVRKNRGDGCFKDIAIARYIIEPRLEGPEKLLYPFRATAIELDLTTQHRFSQAYDVEARPSSH